jgi:hypothetical protein
MRDLITTIGEVAGIGVVAAGLGMIAAPAGVIAAGVGLFAVSFMAGRS